MNISRWTIAGVAGFIILVLFIVSCVMTVRYEEQETTLKLVEYNLGGFLEADTALFSDGRVVIDPFFKGGIFIGGQYREIKRYTIWGFQNGELWRKES